jgi:hypothetical protein
LASALLNHTDPRVTEQHYNRATSMSAAQAYAALIKEYGEGGALEQVLEAHAAEQDCTADD